MSGPDSPAAQPMTAAEIAMNPVAAYRVRCPRGRDLWAGNEPPQGLGDQPDQALAEAAGCLADPPTCPCAQPETIEQQLVAQVAPAPTLLGVQGLRPLDAAGQPTVTPLAAPGDTPLPADPGTPTAAARLAPGFAPYAAARLDMSTFTHHQVMFTGSTAPVEVVEPAPGDAPDDGEQPGPENPDQG